MDTKIKALLELISRGNLYPEPVHTEYDPIWLAEPDVVIQALRFSEYMKHQTVITEPGLRLPGTFRFDGSFAADIFGRTGFRRFGEAAEKFYLKPYKDIVTFDWEHSTIDYEALLALGINGLHKKIAASEKVHAGERDKLDFLRALGIACDGIEAWCGRIAEKYEEAAKTASPERAAELNETAAIVRKTPMNPPETFREALTAVSVCYQFLPDSIGLIDRYFLRFYRADIAAGRITREEAGSLLQELFIIINMKTPFGSMHSDKGGQAHFALGGYDRDMNDIWNELSDLILESLMELPMPCPQLSLRWTKKTPTAVFRKVLDAERHDRYKRIAVISDETRVPAYINILKLPVEIAVGYTTTGCNETAFPGGMDHSGLNCNIVLALTRLFTERRDELTHCGSFDDVFSLFSDSLAKVIDEIIDYQNKFNLMRAKDAEFLSSLFMHGCIESGVSAIRGGTDVISVNLTACGIVNLIDSLTIIDQVIFEEKRTDISTLCDLMNDNWGDGILREYVLRHGKFFGNNDPLSEGIAQRVTTLIYDILKDRKGVFGNHFMLGEMDGYWPHSTWFGERTGATPDGRLAGDPFVVGVGQNGGKDRKGLTPLLLSVAHMDPNRIMTASLVFNVNLDEALINDDANFEKTVGMLETYLREGGVQFQLNYVSRETLIAANERPEDYSSLRVRVSGFSAYYTKLIPEIREDILHRTEVRG